MFQLRNKLMFFVLLSTATTWANRPLSGLNTKDFLNIDSFGVEWSANPFVRPSDNAGVDELTLFAVAFKHHKSAALINDQIVKIGDKIGNSEVVDIQKQNVVLRNENGIYKLSFKRASK